MRTLFVNDKPKDGLGEIQLRDRFLNLIARPDYPFIIYILVVLMMCCFNLWLIAGSI